MDTISLIAAALALASIAFAGFAWWNAREARTIADSANRIAQEAKRAADAQRATGETAARGAAHRAEHETVRAASAPPPASPRTAGTAHLVVRSGSIPGQDLPTNQGSGSGLIGIFLVNEGPAAAHEMQLHATFPNGTRRSSELHRTLSAHKELTLFAQVVPTDFGTDDPLYVLYQIEYQDGNGNQALQRAIRVEGGWKGQWKTFIEATP